MAQGAKVQDIEAIRRFRAYLTKVGAAAALALSDAESDINRTVIWLETEQVTYWNGQIRKRQELLAQAQQALRNKQVFKDASGSQPSVVEEQKAVTKAQNNLLEAQQKLANTKAWIRRMPKEISLYRGGVQPLGNTVAAGMPTALAQLTNAVDWLDKYASTPTDAASTAPAASGGASAMTRSSTEGAEAVAEPEVAVLRAALPAADVLKNATPPTSVDFSLSMGKLSGTERAGIVVLGPELPLQPEDRVIVADAAVPGGTWVVVRLGDGGVYLGPVGGPAPKAYNLLTVTRLLELRSDLAEVVAMAKGFMAVIGPDGLHSVYDSRDVRIWKRE